MGGYTTGVGPMISRGYPNHRGNNGIMKPRTVTRKKKKNMSGNGQLIRMQLWGKNIP